MSDCEHEWQRAPDRDRAQGPMPDGRIGRAWLVFWCPKCARSVTEIVDFDAVTEQSFRPSMRITEVAS